LIAILYLRARPHPRAPKDLGLERRLSASGMGGYVNVSIM
jgi:hypothetical protein